MNILAISRHLLFFGLNRLDKLSPIDQNNIMKQKKTFWYLEDLACFEDQSNQEHEIKQKQLLEAILKIHSKFPCRYDWDHFTPPYFNQIQLLFWLKVFLSKSPRKRVGPILKTKLNFACRPTVYLYVFSYSKDLSLFHFLKSGNCRDGKECFTRWNNESKW